MNGEKKVAIERKGKEGRNSGRRHGITKLPKLQSTMERKENNRNEGKYSRMLDRVIRLVESVGYR